MHLQWLYIPSLVVLGISASPCNQKVSKEVLSKIQFDYSYIDQDGLERGENTVDYEFCIPADDQYANEVLHLEENARLMKSSKGRVGCNEKEWLCIVSTHHPQWKERLYAIASLPYVKKIIRTYYE